MQENDLKTITAAIDCLTLMGERDLSRKIAFKLLLHLKALPQTDKTNSLQEIEANLKKQCAETHRGDGMLDVLPRRGYWNVMIETSLKTLAVVCTLMLICAMIYPFQNVADQIKELRSKIHRGDDRFWNQTEAAISRNPYLYYRAALIHEKKGDLDNAIFQMEKALSLAPRDERYVKKITELIKTRDDISRDNNRDE